MSRSASRLAALALAAGALLCGAAARAEPTPHWPPPPAVQKRMHELQATIRDPGSTLAQREAAREALAALISSPAGERAGRAPGEKPPRAAIEPFPSVVKPLPPQRSAVPPPAPPSGVAHLEVVPPARPTVNPQTGSVPVPSGKFAIDPRSGAVLHEVPGGYVDPRTGQFIPR